MSWIIELCVHDKLYLQLRVSQALTDSRAAGQRRKQHGCHLSVSVGHHLFGVDQLGPCVILLFAGRQRKCN